MKEKTISSEKVYSCSILEVLEDQVLLPNNKEAKRVVIKHNGGACVLPVTRDNLIILTKQYRYPIKDFSIEIPAGKKDYIGEPGIECVKRELEEETNYQSDNIISLYDSYNAIGYSNELIEMYLAKDCYVVENPLPADDDEFIDIMLLTVDEVKEMINNKTIKDMKTILAFNTYLLYHV